MSVVNATLRINHSVLPGALYVPLNFEFPSQFCNCLSLTYYSKVLGLHNFSIIAKLRLESFMKERAKM